MGRRKDDGGYRAFAYLDAGADYRDFELVPQFDRVAGWEPALTDSQAARVERLLDDNIVISLHDHPFVFPSRLDEFSSYVRQGRMHAGYAGLAASRVDAVFDNFLDGLCFITSSAGWKWTDVIHDLGMRLADAAKSGLMIVAGSVDDIRSAHRDGKVALVPGFEAATMIENELDRIDVLYGFGIRQLGIAYNESNQLGSGLRERADGGLTAFGERAVRRMNQLGIAIDISHSGDQTSLDVITTSDAPVFITHCGSRAIWDSPRMKPDHVLVACAERGGVVGVEAAPHTTMSPAHDGHTIDSVMHHFEHIVDLVGIEHVAFGPDTMFGDHASMHLAFSAALSVRQIVGGSDGTVDYVHGMENPAECFPNVVGWLVTHGYSDDDIAKVLGANVLRVLDDVW